MLLCVFIYYYFIDGKEIRTDIWARNFDFNKIDVWERDFPPLPFFEQLHHNSDNHGYSVNTRTGNQANNDINKKRFPDLFPGTVQFTLHLPWIDDVFINKYVRKERAYG